MWKLSKCIHIACAAADWLASAQQKVSAAEVAGSSFTGRRNRDDRNDRGTPYNAAFAIRRTARPIRDKRQRLRSIQPKPFRSSCGQANAASSANRKHQDFGLKPAATLSCLLSVRTSSLLGIAESFAQVVLHPSGGISNGIRHQLTFTSRRFVSTVERTAPQGHIEKEFLEWRYRP